MNLEHFYAQEAARVKILSLPHIAYILFCFGVIYLFIRNRDEIKAKRDKIARIFLWIILFQQIFLQYGWYILCTDVVLEEGLPLHLCRVSSLLTIVFLLKKDTRYLDIVAYFSIYALISFFYPLDVHHFAHIGGISYMINHLVTVLMPIYGVIAYDWRPDWNSYKRAALAFTAYFPCAMIANALTGGNYFYLTNRPFWHDMPLWLFASLAYIVTVGGFALITAIVLHFLNSAKAKKLAEA